MPLGKVTQLGAKQPVLFYDPYNTTNRTNISLNPTTAVLTPSNVRKYTRTANGTSVIVGDREYPPSEIKLTWNYLSYTEYLALVPFTTIGPIVYVDNNDEGYMGVLAIDSAQQIPSKSLNVWNVAASFLVIAPYDGQYHTDYRLAPPTYITSTGFQAGGGYIPTNQQYYIWPTSFSAWGESLPGSVLAINSGASGGNAKIQLTYKFPVSNYFKKMRLYWSNTNSIFAATLLTEIRNDQSPLFYLFTPYVQLSTISPPTIDTSFTGYFGGGGWVGDI